MRKLIAGVAALAALMFAAPVEAQTCAYSVGGVAGTCVINTDPDIVNIVDITASGTIQAGGLVTVIAGDNRPFVHNEVDASQIWSWGRWRRQFPDPRRHGGIRPVHDYEGHR